MEAVIRTYWMGDWRYWSIRLTKNWCLRTDVKDGRVVWRFSCLK